jgi:hypothetical protein
MEDKLKSREKVLLRDIFKRYGADELDHLTDRTSNCCLTEYNEGKVYRAFCNDLKRLLNEKIHFIQDKEIKEAAEAFYSR